jgi:hypothetical protein
MPELPQDETAARCSVVPSRMRRSRPHLHSDKRAEELPPPPDRLPRRPTCSPKSTPRSLLPEQSRDGRRRSWALRHEDPPPSLGRALAGAIHLGKGSAGRLREGADGSWQPDAGARHRRRKMGPRAFIPRREGPLSESDLSSPVAYVLPLTSAGRGSLLGCLLRDAERFRSRQPGTPFL